MTFITPVRYGYIKSTFRFFRAYEDVFVGREKESQDFSDSLDAIVGVKPALVAETAPFIDNRRPARRQAPSTGVSLLWRRRFRQKPDDAAMY
jgi:hypothetical protein